MFYKRKLDIEDMYDESDFDFLLLIPRIDMFTIL